MIFQQSLTIPINTAKAAPKREEIRLVKGLIYQIEIFFPPGCAGLVGLCIKDALHQVWPSKANTWFYSDDETISFDETYEIDNEPASFQIIGYNEDTVWEHTMQIRLGIVDKEIYKARYLPHLAYSIAKETDRLEEERKTKKIIIKPYLPFKSI